MIDRDQTLVLFTASYPYGISETFLETEIIYLSKSFSKIYIIPYNIGESLRSLPSNVEVVENIDDSNYNRSKIVRLYGWQIGKILSIELLKGRVFHREIHYTISLLLRLFERARLLEKWILSSDNRDDIVFYSYWFTEWSTILSILKSRDIIKIFFSKAHRFDLYEYRSKYGFIPFREFQLKHIDRLILISEDGLNYISQKYPKYKDRYILHKLGTEEMGINQFQPKDHIVILSISSLVLVKRVGLLIEILSSVKSKVKWIHFGEGRLYKEINTRAEALPSNIEYDMRGAVSNISIYHFLQNNSIDLFINLSSSEGLPVSIMEVISFGIPVFATDVGGTREIVNEKSGILLDRDIDTIEIANKIDNLRSSHIYSAEFRSGVRNFWRENYLAKENYSKLITSLKEFDK